MIQQRLLAIDVGCDPGLPLFWMEVIKSTWSNVFLDIHVEKKIHTSDPPIHRLICIPKYQNHHYSSVKSDRKGSSSQTPSPQPIHPIVPLLCCCCCCCKNGLKLPCPITCCCPGALGSIPCANAANPEPPLPALLALLNVDA